MTLLVTTDVQCDEDDCLAWINGDTGRRVNGMRARLNAWQYGWTRERRDGRLVDLCPEHSTKGEQ